MTQRLSHYTLLDVAGSGGMGVVHRARDERLEREVAIKLLPAGLLSDDAARTRFRREALALSKLNHPNIATIHDFDHDQGVDFLVMEWVPGETLDRRVSRGPIPEAELIPIALQIADAMAAAHAGGVVHRDLKPANLRITPEGRLKVLDFGLARLTAMDERARTATATEAGVTPGTLAYMPPESFTGRPAEPSGDLFSLGVVLYESATGRRPFDGRNPGEVIHAILQASPAAPRLVNPRISPGLQQVILRLLQREPERRPASAGALLEELRALGMPDSPQLGRGPEPIRSLAVLPLENLSGDPAQEYFADGMTEALIADIARLRELRVISRTSMMRYKGVRKTIAEIAGELRVDSVLEGSVARGGDRVRVSVQLIDVRSETHLWSERYDRAMQDVLELQSDVARAVAREIREALVGDAAPRPDRAVAPAASPPAPSRTIGSPPGTSFFGRLRSLLPKPQTPRPGSRSSPARRVDPEAYDAYLRARHHLDRRSDESLNRALEYLQTALERDPDFALAHVARAEALAVLGFHEFAPPGDAFPKARASARRALELDSKLGEAHAVLGYYALHHEWDWASSERHFRKALEYGPNNATTRLWYVNLLIASGRLDEALAEAHASIEHDPLSLILNLVTGWVHFFRREYEAAFREMGRPLELEPRFFQPHQWRGWTLHQLGRDREAARHLEGAAELIQHEPTSLLCRIHSHAYDGRRGDALAALGELEALASSRHVSPFSVSLCHLAVGNRERALDWLERARDLRSPWIGFLNQDPRMDELRGDPRFEALRALPGRGTTRSDASD